MISLLASMSSLNGVCVSSIDYNTAREMCAICSTQPLCLIPWLPPPRQARAVFAEVDLCVSKRLNPMSSVRAAPTCLNAAQRVCVFAVWAASAWLLVWCTGVTVSSLVQPTCAIALVLLQRMHSQNVPAYAQCMPGLPLQLPTSEWAETAGHLCAALLRHALLESILDGRFQLAWQAL